MATHLDSCRVGDGVAVYDADPGLAPDDCRTVWRQGSLVGRFRPREACLFLSSPTPLARSLNWIEGSLCVALSRPTAAIDAEGQVRLRCSKQFRRAWPLHRSMATRGIYDRSRRSGAMDGC